MIYQFTGQPGHGKSLHALDLALKFQDEGRLVYVGNVRQLDYQKSGFREITPEQFKDWMNFLPDGAVCMIDECYEHDMLPKLGPGMKVPPWVEQLAKHRHRGLDFIFVCQSPSKQMHTFVHDLIERHTHVRRRFGLNFVHLRIFDRYESRPEKAHPISLKRVRLPKRPMGLYQSTELDTTKRGLPWYYWAAGGIVIFVVAGTVWVGARIHRTFDADRVTAKAATPAGNGASATVPTGGVVGSHRTFKNGAEYVAYHSPRIAGMPWTSPAFDDRQVKADPALYCIASGAGLDGAGNHKDAGCTCLTEQGTRYILPPAQCRYIARNGPAYNPYKAPSAAVVAAPASAASAPNQPAADGLPSVSGGVIQKGTNDARTFPESPGFVCETCSG